MAANLLRLFAPDLHETRLPLSSVLRPRSNSQPRTKSSKSRNADDRETERIVAIMRGPRTNDESKALREIRNCFEHCVKYAAIKYRIYSTFSHLYRSESSSKLGKFWALGKTSSMRSWFSPNHFPTAFQTESQVSSGINLPLPKFNGPSSVRSLGYFPKICPPLMPPPRIR